MLRPLNRYLSIRLAWWHFQHAGQKIFVIGLDFLNGVILEVENKGASLWAGAEDDRLIGALWADLSDETCRFVMLKNRDWHRIDACLTELTVDGPS